MHIVLPLILQFVLIALNAIFAMAEIAVISISDAKLTKESEEGNRRATRLLKLKSQPARFLATIQVAITLSGFLGSAFAAENFAEYFVVLFQKVLPDVSPETLETVAVVLITLILSYVSLIFGELVPKRVAMRKTEKTALGLSGTVSAVSRLFAPIVWFLTVSTNAVLRLLGIDPSAAEEEVSEEDILMMADVGAEQGAIDAEEREIIENIFDFDDLFVGEITTHRTDVSILWLNQSDSEWAEAIRNSYFTYYPICDGSVDNVVGILHTKDYFRLQDQSREAVMEHAVRPPYFVLEKAKAHTTFRKMQAEGVSFAIVLDEYAGFAGILTIKDLVERIVGDISSDDDGDVTEEEVRRVDETHWSVKGNVSLTVIEKAMEMEFPDDYESFSGFVIGLYEAVPEDGTQFEVDWENLHVVVSEVKDHQVVSAMITVSPKKDEEE